MFITAKVEAGEDPSATLGTREESEESELTDQLEDLFAAVITATDTVDPTRLLNLVFRLLPSPKVIYKKVITWASSIQYAFEYKIHRY